MLRAFTSAPTPAPRQCGHCTTRPPAPSSRRQFAPPCPRRRTARYMPCTRTCSRRDPAASPARAPRRRRAPSGSDASCGRTITSSSSKVYGYDSEPTMMNAWLKATRIWFPEEPALEEADLPRGRGGRGSVPISRATRPARDPLHVHEARLRRGEGARRLARKQRGGVFESCITRSDVSLWQHARAPRGTAPEHRDAAVTRLGSHPTVHAQPAILTECSQPRPNQRILCENCTVAVHRVR